MVVLVLLAGRACGLPLTAAPLSDGDFLAAYYAALRERLEQRLLFGHRRRDKHDAA